MTSDDLRFLKHRRQDSRLYTCVRRRFKGSQRLSIDVYYVQREELIRLDVPESRYHTKARARWGAQYLVPLADDMGTGEPPEIRLVRELGLLSHSNSKWFQVVRL